MTRQVIKAIPRNASEEIQISLMSYRDEAYIELRIFFRSVNGEMLPTRKGITFHGELAKAVRKALYKEKIRMGKPITELIRETITRQYEKGEQNQWKTDQGSNL